MAVMVLEGSILPSSRWLYIYRCNSDIILGVRNNAADIRRCTPHVTRLAGLFAASRYMPALVAYADANPLCRNQVLALGSFKS